MTNVGILIIVAFCIAVVGSPNDLKAVIAQPLDPKAAQEYASDSEKAAQGDPEAAYRLGKALESGRLGGEKNLSKALTFYKLAAQKGQPEAAARVAEIEAQLGKTQNK